MKRPSVDDLWLSEGVVVHGQVGVEDTMKTVGKCALAPSVSLLSSPSHPQIIPRLCTLSFSVICL